MNASTNARPAALLSAALGLAAAVGACGGGGAIGSGESPAGDAACAVVDGSHSARYAVSEYLDRFRDEVDEAAEDGRTVAAIVVTGDPLTESNVTIREFGDLTAEDESSPRANRVQELVDEVELNTDRARAGGEPTPGSGIVAGIDLVADRGCSSVLILSDGFENSVDASLYGKAAVTPQGRADLLEDLRAKDRIPDLAGVELAFPYGGYMPQGLPRTLPRERAEAVPKFWGAYAEETGAALAWRR